MSEFWMIYVYFIGDASFLFSFQLTIPGAYHACSVGTELHHEIICMCSKWLYEWVSGHRVCSKDYAEKDK